MRNPSPVLFCLLITFAAASFAFSQESQLAAPTRAARPNLLLELGLTPEQVSQIRNINSERRARMDVAQANLRSVVKALDAAIYADNANDETVAARIRDFQAAQSEVVRIRFETELTIRKILTPDQLVKFRELRRQFEEQRKRRRGAAAAALPFQRMGRRGLLPQKQP